MAMIQTPNGAFFIDDAATPQAIALAKADFMARNKGGTARTPKPALLTADQQDVQNRLASKQKHSDAFTQTMDHFFQGVTANHMDEVAAALHAATAGTVNAVRKGSIHEIGRDYRNERDALRMRDEQSAGGGSTAAEIAGALASPLGDAGLALKAGGRVLPVLARTAAKLKRAPAVVQGITTGATQGALNAEGSDSTGHSVTALGQGALTGALTGGVFGTATSGLRRGVQILTDRNPAAAERIASSRIGEMLSKAGIRPERASREMAVTKGRGGDPMVMDMSPGLRAQAGALSRRPEVAASNTMIDRGEQRLLDRPAMFEQQLRAHITPSTGVDAADNLAGIHGARTAHGKTDYEAALDGKFHWSPELQKFLDHAPPEMHAALRDGAHLASLYDQDIGKLGMKIHPVTGEIEMHATPSMRVFDYAKRAMDAKIASAYKAGDKATGGGLSNQLGKFKQLIMDANPDYAPILNKQRDYFQRAQATELGLNVVSRLRTEPKKVLTELKALDPSKADDARTGIADALIALRSQKQDPVSFFAGVARTPEQRKVLEFAFNGKGNLGKFERWIKRELRAKKADVLTAPGRQSETARFQSADDSLNEGVGGLAEHGLRGFAFGGPAGASAAILRKFNDLRTGMSPPALEAMAQALMSDGAKLPEKVRAARSFQVLRRSKNARAAVLAAKAGQQPFTDYTGD